MRVTTLNRPENVATMLLHAPGSQIKYTFLGNWPRLGSKRDEKVSIEIRYLGKARGSQPVAKTYFASLELDRKGYQQDLLLAGRSLSQMGFRVTSMKPASDGSPCPQVIVLQSDRLVAELKYEEPFAGLQIRTV
jgi:hypothetical protein